MKNLNSENFDCTGCALCKTVCPKDSISIQMDSEGFLKYNINEETCIECERCISICPRLSKDKEITKSPKHVMTYAAYSKDDEILKNSSSGGVFRVLAERVLESGGFIFGAAYDEDGKVRHILVDKKEDLYKICGSKYLQSNTEDIYKIVEELLYVGRTVLYTGVSCQITAMKKYIELKELSEKLILVDVVCHGVPSYDIYKKSTEDRFKKEVLKLNARNKKRGWSNYYLTYIGRDNKIVKTIKNKKDEFFMGYIKNYYLNKPCYNCSANKIPRPGDISLGDFWGINEIDPEFCKQNENKGVSIVLLNTEKGKYLFDVIKEKMIYKEENLEKAIKYNPRINEGSYRSEDLDRRNKFFAEDYNTSFKKRRYVDKFSLKDLMIRIKNRK